MEISSLSAREWHCAECGDERSFLQPPCVDGHTDDGAECPEWACVDCGSAVIIDAVPLVAEARRSPRAA